jgi:hypothetical protein
MVNCEGQLYTMEGVAAAIIMVFTMYLVMSTATTYTPGDAHISDMQLEQLGNDALLMMNTPVSLGAESPLQTLVENNNNTAAAIAFNTTFLNYVNNKTGSATDNLHYMASVSYTNMTDNNATWDYPLASNRNLTGVEHPVRVTEWVLVNKQFPGDNMKEHRAALVEVFLWRD